MIMSGGACEIGSVPLPNITWLISAIAQFDSSYGAVHPYIALFLCIAGTLMNLVTVIVLTRPSMVSPVNVLLCSVAVCDVIVMASYLIFVSHFLIGAANRCDHNDYSFAWAVFTLFHAHASVIFHSTSIWLTVSLAQIRVLTISRATSGPTTTITSRFTVALSFITCLIMASVNIPNFLTFEIAEMAASTFLSCLISDDDFHENDVNNSTTILTDPFYDSDLSFTNSSVFMVLASDSDCVKLKLAFWSNGMLFKVVPCFLLTISIVALLKIIADVSHRRRSLAQIMKKKKMPKDHTTPMLVAVLSIFLIAELPQGVMSVLTGIYSRETFHQKIYLPLGNLMDLLSLINSAVNFLIYCAMSRKFRIVFLQLFIRCLPSAFFRDVDEVSKIHEVYESSRTRGRTADFTKSEQLALTSHRPSATSVLVSIGPRDDRLMYRKYGDNLTVYNAVTSPIERKLTTNNTMCSLGEEQCSYANLSPPNVLPLEPNRNDDTHIEQVFISVPKINQRINLSSPIKQRTNGKRRSSNLGMFYSPRNSVEIERQFQESLRRLKKPTAISNLNPMAKLKQIFLKNNKDLLFDDPNPQPRINILRVETNGAGVSF